jgi:hypothetical protein
MNTEEIKRHLNTFKIKALDLKPYQLEGFIKEYFKTFNKDNTIMKLESIDNCESGQSRALSLIAILYGSSTTNWICNELLRMLMTSANSKLHLYKYSCKYSNISYSHTLKISGEFY